MKKSNLILLVGLVSIVFFSLAFQFSVRRYLKKDKKEMVGGVTSNEVRSLPYFEELVVNHGLTVFFTQDSITTVKIQAPESYLPYITTTVTHGCLTLDQTKKSPLNDTIRVFISNPILNSLSVKTNGYFETVGPVSGDQLALDFKKESAGKLNLSYRKIHCKKEEGAQLHLSGDSKEISFSN
ncbi:MAG: DUF2807 domain-containing protein [Bacteroidota bacterium]